MERNERWRPTPAGVSISHPLVSAGTLGCYLWLDGKAYIVSNSHVLADSGQAKVGDETLQPGTFDGAEPLEDAIGHLSFFVPYKSDVPNKVDLAIAEAIPEYVDDVILGLQPGTELLEVPLAEARVRERVFKSGRTTGLTEGVVVSTDTTLQVTGFPLPYQVLMFEDCLLIEGKAAGGDSGSAIISATNGGLLGLLFAGSEEEGVYAAIKITNILAALEQSPQFRVPGVGSAAATRRIAWLVPAIFGGVIVADAFYFSKRRA